MKAIIRNLKEYPDPSPEIEMQMEGWPNVGGLLLFGEERCLIARIEFVQSQLFIDVIEEGLYEAAVNWSWDPRSPI